MEGRSEETVSRKAYICFPKGFETYIQLINYVHFVGLRCFVYRFLSTGTLEERILQRQSHKKSLSSSIVDQDEDQMVKKFDLAMLKRLFKLEEVTDSDTHDNLKVTYYKFTLFRYHVKFFFLNFPTLLFHLK